MKLICALFMLVTINAWSAPIVVTLTPTGSTERAATAQDELARPTSNLSVTNPAIALRQELRALNNTYNNLAQNVQTNAAFTAQQKLILRDLGQLIRDFAGTMLKYYRDE